VTIISLKDKELDDGLSLQQQLQLFNDLQNAKKMLERRQQEKQDALDEISALHVQFAILKKKNSEVQSLLTASEKEKQVWSLKYNEAAEELLKANHTILQAGEEAEERLQVAHQHLAKKMKTVVEQTEKMEELEAKMREISEERDLFMKKVDELTLSLAQRLEEEMIVQKQLDEKIQNAEQLASSWEERYHQLYKQLQEKEAYIQQIEQIKNKYHQMETLWKSFDSVNIASNAKQEENAPSTLRAYQNLFVSSFP